MQRSRVRASVFVVPFVAVIGLLVATCGPSELAKRISAYKPQIERRLDAEDAAYRQLQALAQNQDDPAIAKRYRRHLEEKSVPFYADFEKEVAALDPGHPDLAPVREALISYAKLRRQFIDMQLEHLALQAKVPDLMAVQEAESATNELHSAYMVAVGDEVPDGRLSEVTGNLGGFLKGPYRDVLAGSMEIEQALASLRRDYRPRLQKLRAGRFDDTPAGRAFRSYVVAADDFLGLVDSHLPTIVQVLQAKGRVEAALKGAEDEREKVAKAFQAAERNK